MSMGLSNSVELAKFAVGELGESNTIASPKYVEANYMQLEWVK